MKKCKTSSSNKVSNGLWLDINGAIDINRIISIMSRLQNAVYLDEKVKVIMEY